MRDIIKQLNTILNREQKRMCVILFFSSLIGSTLELFGISAIMPFAELLLYPDEVLNYSWGSIIADFFHCKDSIQVTIIAGLLVAIVYLLKNFYLIKQMEFQIRKVNKIRLELSSKIINSYMKRNYLFFTKTNSSILLRGIDIDVSAVTDVMNNLFRVLAELITVVLVIGYLFYTNAIMSVLIAVVISICLLWFVLGYRKRVRKAGKKYNECAALASQAALQTFGGIKEIKVMNKEKYFTRRYIELLDARIEAENRKGIYEKKPPYLYEAIFASAFLGIICLLMGLDIQIQHLVPQIAVFAIAAFRIISSAGRISSSLNGAMFVRKGLDNAYHNVLELQKYEETFAKSMVSDKSKEVHFYDKVQIRNLSWKYPDRDNLILDNVSFNINKGEAVALVGSSGAGKTTMADLILGLLVPDQGDITIDDKSIYAIKENWAQLIGYVPQNSYLIDDTIRRNVAFGVPEEEIDDYKVWIALEKAQIKEFVERLEQKIDTVVGESGVRFSGGQRQRIAIARALYNDPDILILDEATSALDNDTEKALMESIEKFYGEKTIIVIAHRLSTIEKCDTVYEVTDGKLKCIKGEKTSAC